jgi:TPR repeat protein
MDYNYSSILSDDEINELKDIFKYKYCNFLVDTFSRKIYNLFIKGIIFEPNNESDNESFYVGVYYNHININYSLAKKYYLISIDKGNIQAMCSLGLYYRFIERNWDLMKKYYLMAIDKGNTEAMNNLGLYYQDIEKNYDLMKQYYLMAIDKGSNE